jgi:hypothetical protein
MKKLLSLALAALLCAPAFAQRPKIEQSIAMGDVKMSLNYQSIPYGGGKTAEALVSKEGADMRAHMNKRWADRPLATFTSSVDVKCGDLTLTAGEHQVYFSVGDDLKWSINFKSGDKVQTMKLALQDGGGEHMAKQLLMALYAEPNGAGVYCAFGSWQTMLTFVPANAAKADASGKKPEAGK